MEFRVLGPLEVIGPRGLIKIGGPVRRAILTLLVLHVGETVSTDQLIDEVWGDDPPGGARHALEVHVSGLRRAIGADRVETRPNGYSLRGERSDVDLVRFESLVADASRAFSGGDPASASAQFAEALGLWRGLAIEDVVDGTATRAERTHLDDLRALAIEWRVDAELARGRHLELVPELRRFVSEKPLDEVLQTRLMLALYRSGRQADALEVYQRARDVLDRELGVEPGRELEALQHAVLTHDPALDLQVARRRQRAQSPGLANPPNPETRPHDIDMPQTDTRRTVTALFAEVSGPAALEEAQDPETARRTTDRIFDRMREMIERHGGTVDKPFGRALIAIFGVRLVHEDDAVRAVRAAADIRELIVSLNEDFGPDLGAKLTVQVGVSTGEVVAGAVAGAAPIVAGDVVDLAARLARQAMPDEILLGIGTYNLVRWTVDAEPVSADSRGDLGHLNGVRLVGVTLGIRGHTRRFDSTMVGRTRELGLLRSASEQATAAQRCQLFTLLGPAGIGKSRLAHEFLRSVRPEALVARGRCPPYGERVALWPVAEAIRQAAEIGEGDNAADVRTKIQGLVRDDPRATVIADQVAALLDVSQVSSASDETFWAIRNVFEALARTRLLAVVFDDMQWAEPTFVDFVEYLSDTSRGAPILLLCIARPELLDERPGWAGGHLNATTVRLEPLGDTEVARLITNLLGGWSPSPAFERRIVDAAEGNPLFVEEFVSMLLDDGSVRRSGDKWVATADLSTIATPASIMALLAARLDRLPKDEIDVLRRAAVVGKVFDREAVAALLEHDDVADVERRLGALVRREVIRPDRSSGGRSDSYRFKHILIRDAAYASVPKVERVVLHERLAEWLSRSEGSGRRPIDEVIGSHLEQAYRYRTELGPLDVRARAVGRMAAARLAAVGRRAHVRGDAGVAEGMLSRAAALLPADDRERLLLLSDLTEARIERVELESARRTTDELMESARVTGMADVTWRATLYQIELDFFADTDISQHITDSVRKAIQFFDTVGDDRALGLAWFLIGSLEMGRGHYRQGRQANERAIDHARRAGDLRAEGRSMVEVAWIDLYGPATVTVARRTAQELLDWARAAGVQGTEAIALGYLGRLTAMVGKFDEARRLVEASGALSNQLGRRYLVAGNVSWWMGLVDWLAGDPAAATSELRSGYEQLERLGDRTMRPDIAADLARMLYLQHRLDDAFNYTQISEAFGPRTEVRVGIGWRGVRGMILARRGEWSAAINLAREAVATAETTDMLFYHARALEDLAEVLELSGSSDEAGPVLAKAIGLYEQKGITVLAERARQRVGAAAIAPTRKASYV